MMAKLEYGTEMVRVSVYSFKILFAYVRLSYYVRNIKNVILKNVLFLRFGPIHQSQLLIGLEALLSAISSWLLAGLLFRRVGDYFK